MTDTELSNGNASFPSRRGNCDTGTEKGRRLESRRARLIQLTTGVGTGLRLNLMAAFLEVFIEMIRKKE